MRPHPYQVCKTIGHAWFEIDATHPPEFGYYMWLQCERCGTIRMDTIDIHFELGARSYRHPPGYRDAERLTKVELRRYLIGTRTGQGRLTKAGGYARHLRDIS